MKRLSILLALLALAAPVHADPCKVTVSGSLRGVLPSSELKANMRATFRLNADIEELPDCDGGSPDTVLRSVVQSHVLTDPASFEIDLWPNSNLSGMIPATTIYEVTLETTAGDRQFFLQVPYSSTGRTWSECHISQMGDPQATPFDVNGGTIVGTTTMSPPAGSPYLVTPTDSTSPTWSSLGVGSRHFDGYRDSIKTDVGVRQNAYLDDVSGAGVSTITTGPGLVNTGTASDPILAVNPGTAINVTGNTVNVTLGSDSNSAAAGDDARFPTADEKAALAGTGAPGAGDPYVNDSDSRMTDARPPTAHASTHEAGGSDPITTVDGWLGQLVDPQTILVGDGVASPAAVDTITTSGLLGISTSTTSTTLSVTETGIEDAIDHNDIQGLDSGDYQHLTQAEHDVLVTATATPAADSVPVSEGDGKLSGNWLDDGDIDHNSTGGLDTGDYQHLTQVEHDLLTAASATPGASIPIVADGDGKIGAGWLDPTDITLGALGDWNLDSNVLTDGDGTVNIDVHLAVTGGVTSTGGWLSGSAGVEFAGAMLTVEGSVAGYRNNATDVFVSFDSLAGGSAAMSTLTDYDTAGNAINDDSGDNVVDFADPISSTGDITSGGTVYATNTVRAVSGNLNLHHSSGGGAVVGITIGQSYVGVNGAYLGYSPSASSPVYGSAAIVSGGNYSINPRGGGGSYSLSFGDWKNGVSFNANVSLTSTHDLTINGGDLDVTGNATMTGDLYATEVRVEKDQTAGTATLSSGSATVTFTSARGDANYTPIVAGDTSGEVISVASVSTTGFTINSDNASSTATVYWAILPYVAP